MTAAITDKGVTIYQLTVLKVAMKAHLRGVQVNQAYTRKRMLKTVGRLLQKEYKISENGVVQAIADVEEFLNKQQPVENSVENSKAEEAKDAQ